MSFSVSRAHPGCHITFHHYVYSGSSWLWQFLRLTLLFFFWRLFRYWGVPVWWSVECSSSWVLGVFLIIRLELGLLKKQTTEMKCCSSHMPSSTINDVNFSPPAEVVLPRFSPGMLLFPPLSILFSEKGSPSVEPTFNRMESCSPLP